MQAGFNGTRFAPALAKAFRFVVHFSTAPTCYLFRVLSIRVEGTRTDRPIAIAKREMRPVHISTCMFYAIKSACLDSMQARRRFWRILSYQIHHPAPFASRRARDRRTERRKDRTTGE